MTLDLLREGDHDRSVGILTIYFITHTPERATCLTKEQKAATIVRMKHDAHRAGNNSDAESETCSWTWDHLVVCSRDMMLPSSRPSIITPTYAPPLPWPLLWVFTPQRSIPHPSKC